MEYQEQWINYGMVMKLPHSQIDNLKEFCKKNNYYLIFDKESPYRIILTEIAPSSNLIGGADEQS